MKHIILFTFTILSSYCFCQNVGINNTDPQSTLDVTGSIRVQSPLVFSTATPTAAQTYTMNNTSSTVTITDSVSRILDPGGTGSYINNTQGNIFLNHSFGSKISFNPSTFGIGTGDTLWIGKTTFPGCRTNYLHRYTNTTTSPNELLINGNSYIVFRSDGDGNNGVGFDITTTRLYPVINSNPPIQAVGTAFYFDNITGALRAGNMGSGIIGQNSTAFGNKTIASGNEGATALGSYTVASGDAGATAMGYNTAASGQTGATALGYSTYANGDFGATALGEETIASGEGGATALGRTTIASGNDGATAIGFRTNALSYASLATGRYNDTIAGSSKTSWVATDPLLTVGNGSSYTSRSNAVTVYKNGNTDLNGFVRLGKVSDDAPRIKMKELPITNTATIYNQSKDFPHGLIGSKIISVNILVEWYSVDGGYYAPPEYGSSPNLKYSYYVSGTNIVIQNNCPIAAECLINNKPVKILITYKE